MNKIRAQTKLVWIILFLTCLAFVGMPQIAQATKTLPPGIVILLGFKERYGDDNKQHLGIDVRAEEGSEIKAPVGGTISFVGRVPGSAGLNVTAITITTEDGQQVSLNPLATTKVKKGDTVVGGQTLGTLSAFGDPSSCESHFHLSLRVKGVYRDPTYLLMENSVISQKESGTVGSSSIALSPPASTSAASPSSAMSSSAANQASVEKSDVKAKNGDAQKVTQPSTESVKIEQKVSAQSKSVSGATAASTAATASKALEENHSALGKTAAAETKNSTANIPVKKQGLEAKTNPASQELHTVTNHSASREKEPVSATHSATGIEAESGIAQQAWNRLILGVDTSDLNSSSLYLEQEGVLFIRQGSSLGLQAEFMKYLEGMSQAQLSMSMLALALFVACACFGVVKIAQIMGVDSAILKARERFADFVQGAQKEGAGV